MTTFVLVHGLTCGGWCWQRVSKLLMKKNHPVYTPTLTGLGERSHLLNPDIDLDTHITDIVNMLVWEDLQDVILVGHSYGGVIIRGVADKVPERINHLVYLDAHVPANGQSVFDLMSKERVAYYQESIHKHGEGWFIPPPPADFWELTDTEDKQLINALCMPHPVKTLQQKIRLERKEKPSYTRSYIWAADFQRSPFGPYAKKYRNDPDWNFIEMKSTGHMMMISHPEYLSDVLLGLVNNY